MEDLTSMGQHKSHPEFHVVTRESGRNSRKSTWFPRHRKMKPFPATASQEKSHVRNWRSKRYLAPLMRPHKVPRPPGLPGEGHRGFPAPLPLSPFYPPDLHRRLDSPALSGRGYRPSGRKKKKCRSFYIAPVLKMVPSSSNSLYLKFLSSSLYSGLPRCFSGIL